MVSRSKSLLGRGCLFACIALALSACGGGGGGDGMSTPRPINVNPNPPPTMDTATGSVLLTWMPAQTNTDQTPYTDPAGYVIGIGSTPDAMDRIETLTNFGLDAFMVDNLPQGTSYFVIMSVNSQGILSGPSPVISKTIN